MLPLLRSISVRRWQPPAARLRCAYSAASQQPLDVVVRDDGSVAEHWSGTSKDFLATHPRGAYTTARTVRNGAAIFELDAHIDRTAESLRLMHGATVTTGLEAALKPAAFRERFMNAVAAALRCFYAQGSDAAPEARVTVLAAWEDNALKVYCHAGQLPPPPPSPVVAEVRGSPRSSAAAKDSAWVTARQGLEQLRGSDVDEVILCGAGGELLEGSQTNFYAVRDGTLWTAGEGVCAQHDVKVVTEPPLLRDLHTWDGCLISSTSRLLLPIDTQGIPWDKSIDDSRSFNYAQNKDSLTHSLAMWVAEEVDDNSVAL